MRSLLFLFGIRDSNRKFNPALGWAYFFRNELWSVLSIGDKVHKTV